MQRFLHGPPHIENASKDNHANVHNFIAYLLKRFLYPPPIEAASKILMQMLIIYLSIFCSGFYMGPHIETASTDTHANVNNLPEYVLKRFSLLGLGFGNQIPRAR